MQITLSKVKPSVGTDRIYFLQGLFKQIRPYPYVVMKTLEPDLEDWNPYSDVDILCTRATAQHLEAFIHQSKSIVGYQVRRSTYDHKYFLFFKDQTFLQLDVLFKLIRKDIEYLSKEEIFDQHFSTPQGIKLANRCQVMEHAFLFSLLNHSGLSSSYIQRFEAFPLYQQKEFLRLLYQKYQISIHQIQELATFDAAYQSRVLKKLLSLSQNSLPHRLKRSFFLYRDHLRLRTRGKGKILSFSGVDGAGKSTVLSHFCATLEQKYRQPVVVLRHRPGLFPILSSLKYGKAEAEKRSATTLPRMGKNQNPISSAFRFSYYLLDYLIGRTYIRWKYLRRGVTVLFDRYYFDFIVDGKRSNIQLPSWLVRAFWPLIQKPDLNFFLFADPETILARKQELDPAAIESLTKQYQALFASLQKGQSKPQFIPIHNADLAETLELIESHYIQSHLHQK